MANTRRVIQLNLWVALNYVQISGHTHTVTHHPNTDIDAYILCIFIVCLSNISFDKCQCSATLKDKQMWDDGWIQENTTFY